MDLPYAVERHRQPLLRIVTTLYAMIGLTEGGSIERLAWPLYRVVLAILRPAESAVRRLIVVAAKAIVINPQATHRASSGRAGKGKANRKRKGQRSFPLFDPCMRQYLRRRFHAKVPRAEPRIHFFDFDPRIPAFLRSPPPPPPPPKPKEWVNAGALCRRLAAIRGALNDLQRQARRYARWQAKVIAGLRPKRDALLRQPPGLRAKSSQEIHEILKECDWLARTMPQPNTG